MSIGWGTENPETLFLCVVAVNQVFGSPFSLSRCATYAVVKSNNIQTRGNTDMSMTHGSIIWLPISTRTIVIRAWSSVRILLCNQYSISNAPHVAALIAANGFGNSHSTHIQPMAVLMPLPRPRSSRQHSRSTHARCVRTHNTSLHGAGSTG